jgi:predicted permease
LANKKTYLIAAVRLVLAPLMIFGILKLCHLDFALTPAVMIYAMPCGMNSIIFPQLVGKDCRLGASTVLISTALSMLTIPLMLTLLL